MTQNGAIRVRRRTGARAAVSVEDGWQPNGLPALVRATVPGVDLADWLARSAATVDELAGRAGAVLFRGFEVRSADDFRVVMDALSGEVLGYGERSSPRTQVSDGVYTSTEHPADQPIVLHNEQSYARDWPLRITFFCETPPGAGGRTPLADSRRLLARLSPETVARFDRLGVRYVRNYIPGISLSWRDAFQVETKAEVAEYCAKADIHCEWVGSEHLRTYQVRPAVHEQPRTGERTWFNHALFFHVSSLPDEVSSGLLSALAEEDLPYHTFYGDGTPIAPETIDELRTAYALETVGFDWCRGDVLVVENMLVAHGREPFSGPRRILAAMSDPMSTAPRTVVR